MVLDNLMAQWGGDRCIPDLVAERSNHGSLSGINDVQTLYHEGKATRNIKLDARFIML